MRYPLLKQTFLIKTKFGYKNTISPLKQTFLIKTKFGYKNRISPFKTKVSHKNEVWFL